MEDHYEDFISKTIFCKRKLIVNKITTTLKGLLLGKQIGMVLIDFTKYVSHADIPGDNVFMRLYIFYNVIKQELLLLCF